MYSTISTTNYLYVLFLIDFWLKNYFTFIMFSNFNFYKNVSYYPLRQNCALFLSKFCLSNDIDFYPLSPIPVDHATLNSKIKEITESRFIHVSVLYKQMQVWSCLITLFVPFLLFMFLEHNSSIFFEGKEQRILLFMYYL